MLKYRISKYNPINRTDIGVYKNDEWTSCWDINKVYNDIKFTKEKYLLTEKNYIVVVNWILEVFKIDKLYIGNIEKNYSLNEVIVMLTDIGILIREEEKQVYREIKENFCVDCNNISYILQYILRECFWCKLFDKYSEFKIEFGYDFYLYVTCNELPSEVVEKAANRGIYIEDCIS